MKSNEQTDPEGLPLDRELSKQADEVQPTSSGITPTSPTPLTARPAGFIVGSEGPGQPAAPEISVQAPKAARGNDVKEYKQPTHDLPETISARQIYNDRSNADGCTASEVQR